MLRSLGAARGFLDHTNPIFKNLNILKLIDIYKLQVGASMHKIFYKNMPALILDNVAMNQNEHIYQTRQSSFRIAPPNYSLEGSRKSLSFKGSNLWNDLDDDIRGETSLKRFKYKLKQSYLEAY